MKMIKLRKLIVLGLAIPALFTGVAIAAGDAYDPLRTTVGNNGDNILEYVVEDGAVEINHPRCFRLVQMRHLKIALILLKLAMQRQWRRQP